MIPFVDLAAQQRRLGDRLRARVDAVLEHGQYIMGPEVRELEVALAERCAVPHVVGCASGTDALVMALMALGVQPGDAVLVPTFTFTATAEVVAFVGATPVFCDVDADTFNLDLDSASAALAAARESGARVVGVIPVDLFGLPADHAAIGAWADREGLWVLADAAQSVGGAVSDRPVGSLAPVTATSFFPAKPLGCYGDGGAVFTTDAAAAEVLRSVREHGKGTDRYHTARLGLNGRLDTIQAAVLLAKLEVFDEEVEARQAVARRYQGLLGDHVVVPSVPEGYRSAWAQFTIRLANRDEVAAHLRQQGYPTAIYYPVPLHHQPPYRDAPRAGASLPVAERLCGEVLSLPMHPYLAAEVQQGIAEVVRRAARPIE